MAQTVSSSEKPERPEQHRLAIVTGASSGIGEATARDLLARGWSVIGVSRRSAQISNERYTHVGLDLGAFDRLTRVFEERIAPLLWEERWNRIALVNNAAVTGPLAPLERVAPDELMTVYAVNSVAPVWLMGFVSRASRPGIPVRIVNVSTGAATEGVPGLSVYGSSKAALRLAGMAFASESAKPPTGVVRDLAILSYEPGVVETQMQAQARSTPADVFPWVDTFQRFQAEGLLVSPEDVTGEIAAFVESDPRERFTERRHGGRAR